MLWLRLSLWPDRPNSARPLSLPIFIDGNYGCQFGSNSCLSSARELTAFHWQPYLTNCDQYRTTVLSSITYTFVERHKNDRKKEKLWREELTTRIITVNRAGYLEKDLRARYQNWQIMMGFDIISHELSGSWVLVEEYSAWRSVCQTDQWYLRRQCLTC